MFESAGLKDVEAEQTMPAKDQKKDTFVFYSLKFLKSERLLGQYSMSFHD